MSVLDTAYDVVIVGAAAVGSSAAYYLAANPDFDGTILILERDTSFHYASTSLSAASIRTQFSNALNVQMSQYGLAVIRDFADMMAVDADRPDLGFHSSGYLYLASSEEQADILRQNHDVQIACGADVVLWGGDDVSAAFPHLVTDDICLAAYGRSGEGWFSNTGLMNGFRKKARALGASYAHDEVVGIETESGKATALRLRSGARVAAGVVINAAGPRAGQVARMAGVSIPVEPRKRTVFVFNCAASPEGSARVNGGRLPLMIDPSGVYCRPEGGQFLTGAVPAEDTAVEYDDFDPRHSEFEDLIWPVLAARSPAFEAIRQTGLWAGHYAYNTFDQNLIIGPHPDLPNFLLANGFSGHGLQQSPAVGRALSELVTYGAYRTLDLSPLGYDRILEGKPYLERAII